MSDCVTCGSDMPAGCISCGQCGSPNYLLIAQGVLQDESVKQEWSAAAIAGWMRDGLVCVYCGRDMLESYDVVYHGYATDHLLPVSKYPELDSQAWNLVLACRACNSFKLAYDPNDPPIYIPGQQLTLEVRSELLDRAKKYIKEKRQHREMRFQKEKQAIQRAVKSLRAGLAAAAK